MEVAYRNKLELLVKAADITQAYAGRQALKATVAKEMLPKILDSVYEKMLEKAEAAAKADKP